MKHTLSKHELAHNLGTSSPQKPLKYIFCVIMLLAMLTAALLPIGAARAQDVPTQTPTATLPATETPVVLTETPAATPDPAALTPAPTSTSQAATPALDEASPLPPLNAAPPVDNATASSVGPQSSPPCPTGLETAVIKLDGITILVCAPILPGDFIIPDPSSSDQIATAAILNPYQEFSITAIPYGMRVSTETLPAAEAGIAGQYLQILKDARLAQGGTVKDGPTASIFGNPISSIASLVSLKIHGDTPSDVVIVEWVADAGNRLWIIRTSQEAATGAGQTTDDLLNAAIQSQAQVVLSSPELSTPSTSAAFSEAYQPPPSRPEISAAPGDLPFPSWWSGDCDVNNFPGSYPLGGKYRGVKACGPINTQRVVRFGPGLWGELEWQCVELSMRFMYLAYGILPYPGNGKDVVWNYTPKSTDHVQMVKISNDTVGKFPQAGDVLSYGTTSTYGHTSVVTGSTVDSSGNGTVTIIEQNVSSPSNGVETLAVTSWHVKSWMLISGWLHGNNPAPMLVVIDPTSITAGETGLVLDVFGQNFLPGSVVRWNGTSLPTAFVSSAELIAAVPDSSITTAGTASVTVYTPSPGGGTSSARPFTINNNAPTLTGISPTTTLIGGSTFTLTVTGTNYFKTSKVLWNGTALTTTYVSGTQLTAAVSSTRLTKAGPVNITVTTPPPGGGTSEAQIFTVNYRVPTLTSISPTSAMAGASSLTLTVNGTYFVPGATVRWNGADLATTYISSIKLTALVPAANLTLAGTAQVTVFNPSPGGGASAGKNFTINNPLPGMTGLSPDHMTAGAGALTLTVNGKNFVSTSTVRWNGIDLTTTFVNSTQLTAQVTAQLAANPAWMNITVYNPPPAGGASTALIFKVASQTPGVCVKARDIALNASDSYNNGGTGSTNNIDTYPITTWDMHGPEFTYLFNTTQPATVAVNIWDSTALAKAFLIDGASGSCSAANGLAYGTKIVFNALANHNYYFVVDGNKGAAVAYKITVDAFNPTDGSQIQTARPIFQWPAIEKAKTYTLQVSTSSSFSSYLLNKVTSKTSYAVGTALPSNKQLYWRVKTDLGSYIYMPKKYLSFKTGSPPGVPTLSYPTANGLLTIYTPLLDWSDSTLPSGVSLSNYQIQVALDSAFTNIVTDQFTNKSAYQVTPPGLTPDTKYYWRVQAFGSNGSTSNWTSARYFRAAMLPTSLLAPANRTIPAVTTLRPTFTWTPVNGVSSYTIQIATTSSFASLLVNTKASGTSYTPTSNLPSGRVLYWRVRAEGANGPSLWSQTFSFKTP